jgi:hypothetical protein
MNGRFSQIVRLVILGALVAAANGVVVRAQMAPPQTLDPATYKSPGGTFAVTINPSDIYGRYGGTYRVAKNGKEVWAKPLPFTLCNAAITDTGVVAGYGYTLGEYGIGKSRGPGDMIVVLIDPSGALRLKQVTKRQHGRALHAPPFPLAHGLIVDEPNDRLIVRLHDYEPREIWWTYRLSSGAVLDKRTPKRWLADDGRVSDQLLDAKLIRGTPLVLLHWWRYDGNLVGARFTAVDAEAKPVWSLERPRDYTIARHEEAQGKLRSWIREHGGILRADQPGQFDLFFAAESKRVTFSVKQDPSGEWTAGETGRTPFSIEPPKAAEPEVSRQLLKELPPLVLQAKRAADDSPVRNVRDFVIDGKGRIAFVREDENHASRFVLIDKTGNLLREVSLKLQPVHDQSNWSGLCWVGGDRYVISLSEIGPDGKSKAWWIDAPSAATQPSRVEAIPAFDCPSIRRLVGASDGRFVALANLFSKYTIETSVIGFDAQGRRQWTVKVAYDDQEHGGLFTAEDIARTTDGQIVVLDNIASKLKSFDRDGHFLRTIDLEKAWGRKPNYASKIAADIDGGCLVLDFQGRPPFVRMTRDGAVRAEFEPKHADGRVVGTVHNVGVDADGHIWISDGHSILRLNDKGVVDRILGPHPVSALLGKIAGISVDVRGRFYAVDSRTGSVQVFDPAGKLLHVCETKPSDFNSEIHFPALTTDDKGDVYLGLGGGLQLSDDRRQYAHFSANGTRMGTVELPAAECSIQPGSGNFVAKHFQDVSLIDPAGKTLRTIDRRPDGNWLDMPHAVALASDGSIAIVANHTRTGGITVNLYKANGDPVCTIPLPESAGGFPRIAYDGRRLIVAGDALFLIFDETGRPLWRSQPPLQVPQGMYYYPYILSGGGELALFDGKEPVLHRYELP